MLSRLASQQSFRLVARTQAARIAPKLQARGLSDAWVNASEEEQKEAFRTDRLLHTEKTGKREYQYQFEQSIMEKTGLNAYEVQYPIGIMMMVTMLSKDILQLNEELTLGVMSVLCFGYLKQAVGPMLCEQMMTDQEECYKVVTDKEERTISEMAVSVDKLTYICGPQELRFSEDVKSMNAAVDEMNGMKTGVSNFRKQKAFRAQITKELDAIIQEETRLLSLRQSLLVGSATEYVMAQLVDEKNVKQAFKDAVEAIGSLNSPPKADVVTSLYKDFFTNQEQLAAVDAKMA